MPIQQKGLLPRSALVRRMLRQRPGPATALSCDQVLGNVRMSCGIQVRLGRSGCVLTKKCIDLFHIGLLYHRHGAPRMRRIVHHELGDPAQVLRVEDGPSESLGPNQVRVRLSCAPIHPGDLLGVMGSPAFGTPPTIASGGRVPGFEGAGVVSEVGAKVDPALGLKRGLRVAFFPASGAWSDEAVVSAGSVVPLPDSIPDEVGAQMLINTVTALIVIRAAHDSLPPDARTGVVTPLTGAGSAVGRLIGKALTERGVKVIRLVRSEASAAKLTGILPRSPVFATELAAWKDRARAAAEGAKIHVAIDSVGGRLLGDVADLLAEGTGTVINFGSLGGETSDIRLFSPRSP